MLRNLGQKNASGELFIMILPSSICLLQRIDNTIFKREGKHHYLKKNIPRGVIFWGLKFDIFSIPNFLATFYVLGSPVENDLNY